MRYRQVSNRSFPSNCIEDRKRLRVLDLQRDSCDVALDVMPVVDWQLLLMRPLSTNHFRAKTSAHLQTQGPNNSGMLGPDYPAKSACELSPNCNIKKNT